MNKANDRSTTTGLAKVVVQWFTDTLGVNQILILRINNCFENRHRHQARNRKSFISKKLLLSTQTRTENQIIRCY